MLAFEIAVPDTPPRGSSPLPRPTPGLWRLRLPPGTSALRQVAHGFLLPWVVLQALLSDPADRRRYFRITGVQTLLTLLLAVAAVPLYQSATELTGQVEHEAELALQKTLGVVQSGLTSVGDQPPEKGAEDEYLASLERSAQGFRTELETLRIPEPPPPPAGGPDVPLAPPVGGPFSPPPPAAPGPQDPRERLVRQQERLRERQQTRELEAQHRQQELQQRVAERERVADTQQRAQALREQALENAARIREQTDALRAAAQEAVASIAEAAQNNPELAAELAGEQAELQREIAQGQAQLQRELSENQNELAKEMEQLQRSTEALATRSALRATEALRIRIPALEGGVPLSTTLRALENRLEAVEEDEALTQQQRVDLAMQSAVESAFVAERAREEVRRLRQQLRRGDLTEEEREATEDGIEEAQSVAEEAGAVSGLARAQAKEQLSRVALRERRGEVGPGNPQQELARAMVELSPSQQLLLYLAALYTALYVVQFLVISFSRDYHDQLSRKAALATGIAPEDPELRPRVHLDWRWLRTRIARRWRALKLFGFGVPVIYLVTWPLPGDLVRTVLLTLWGVYWFAVFVAAKSARAWVDEGLAREPWFMRLAGRAARRIKLLGSLPFRLYGRLWRRHGLAVFAPAECVEQQPFAFAGLTVFRFLASLPLLKLFLRPLTPIAVAHLLEAHREFHPPRAAKVAEVLANQRHGPPEFAHLH